MRAWRLALALVGSAGIVTLVATAGAHAGAKSPTVKLSSPLPSVIRVDDQLTVLGHIRNAPARTRAALEIESARSWQVVARVRLHKHGAFRLSWRVTGPAYRSLALRVVALKGGHVLAFTPAHQSQVGPAAVYCAPPVPPKGPPPADGWIVGGLYGEGGAYPGMYACIPYPYILTVSDAQGAAVATQSVGASKSYTVVLAPGRYTLKGGCGSGSATVTAGKQTIANMYCLYP